MSLEKLKNILLKIPGCSEVSDEGIGKWMVCDSSAPGFLNDDELIKSVREKSVEQKADDVFVSWCNDVSRSSSFLLVFML